MGLVLFLMKENTGPARRKTKRKLDKCGEGGFREFFRGEKSRGPP